MWTASCKCTNTYCERQSLLDVACGLLVSIFVNLLQRALLKQRIPVILHRHKTSKVRLHIAKTTEIIITVFKTY